MFGRRRRSLGSKLGDLMEDVMGDFMGESSISRRLPVISYQ
jgi:hypothetical protein